MKPEMTLLYDASCPVCSLEMDHLRARDRDGRLAFVDISAPGFDAAAYGTSWAALDAEIHAMLPDGRMIRGLQVLRRAYAAAGIGWVLAPTGTAPLRPLGDLGYRWFARHRRTISRLAAPLIAAVRARRMRACSAGACAHDGGRR